MAKGDLIFFIAAFSYGQIEDLDDQLLRCIADQDPPGFFHLARSDLVEIF